jgi:hypothetical protein
MPVIPILHRLRQKNCEFQATLGYIVKSCLKTKQNLLSFWVDEHLEMLRGWCPSQQMEALYPAPIPPLMCLFHICTPLPYLMCLCNILYDKPVKVSKYFPEFCELL